ncbi:mpv17-like protein 2 [Panonychus citri]|uniref:mpv17-like protein 2 n=1 Tax=Panonychus citri TaxID=50023 RepID=UPI00230756D6|nr:mpv17-like protein 2 [Panonychus citri]
MGLLVTSRLLKVGQFINGTLFGRRNLLLTNCLLSTALGSLGDAIQQHYDIITNKINEDKKDLPISTMPPCSPSSSLALSSSLSSSSSSSSGDEKFNFTRNLHMSAAGFTTGLVTHVWYILLDRYLGTKKCLKLVTVKVLLDQIMFSPVNLAVYFGTVAICEQSTFRKFKDELIEKGMENIYLWEWAIWPPAQYINFYILPLRYRILFDNIISLGFDIYSPYVKYKTELRKEKQISNPNDQSSEFPVMVKLNLTE